MFWGPHAESEHWTPSGSGLGSGMCSALGFWGKPPKNRRNCPYQSIELNTMYRLGLGLGSLLTLSHKMFQGFERKGRDVI